MVSNGYNRYRSVANESHFVGFNHRGKPLRKVTAQQNGKRKEKCFNFLKFDTEFNINDHNQKLAGGNVSAKVARVQLQAHEQPRKNKRNKQSSSRNATLSIRHNHHRNSNQLS